VLEHLHDLRVDFARLVAIMAPDGSLFIEVPHGSGHPVLPFDTNPGHAHCFSVGSLSRLVEGFGLEISRIADDCYESVRYPRSLRVLVRRRRPPEPASRTLELEVTADERLVVWGAGGMTRELLLPFFPVAHIAYFVDRDPALQGTTLAGKPIRAPEVLAEAGNAVVVLIATIDHEAAVIAEVARTCRPSRVVTLRSLLEH
jgi:hypothetical protein